MGPDDSGELGRVFQSQLQLFKVLHLVNDVAVEWGANLGLVDEASLNHPTQDLPLEVSGLGRSILKELYPCVRLAGDQEFDGFLHHVPAVLLFRNLHCPFPL